MTGTEHLISTSMGITTETIRMPGRWYQVTTAADFTMIDWSNDGLSDYWSVTIRTEDMRPAEEWLIRTGERLRITPADAGTWLDGRHGWHNAYRVVDRAEEYGFIVPEEYADALRRYREEDYAGLTDDEAYSVNESVAGHGELAETATDYLQERAPEGYVFEWDAGELRLMSEREACEACTEDNACPEHCDCGEC